MKEVVANFDALPGTYVVQCSSCKTILGDTSNYLCSIQNDKYIVLKAATDVTVDQIAHKESKVTDDIDATYFNVCCSGCGSVVGKMFTTLPRSAKTLTNRFCFDTDRCSSYLIGSSTVKSAIDSEATEVLPHRAEGNAGMEGAPGADGATGTHGDMLMEKIAALETDLIKMQAMILLHDGQLRELPGYPVAGSDGGL